MLLTSGSSLTTFVSTEVIASFRSTMRVYEPTGTRALPTTSFTSLRFRSNTVRSPAGFERGTASTSLFEQNLCGRSTSRSLNSACVNSGLADMNTSAGAP
jgi:hypothetical protein